MERTRSIERRRFLRTAGAVAVGAGLAGCADGGGGGGDGDQPGSEGSGEGQPESGSDEESGGGDPAGGSEEGPEAGENETGDEPTGDDGGDAGEEVLVGPGGDFVFEPEELSIEPGTTVRWVWESDTHNVVPESQPDEADWEGHESIENTGYEYTHTFEVEGTYEYVCVPHEQQGMFGTVVVGE